MNSILRVFSAAMYVAAALMLIFYFVFDLSTNTAPYIRLLILGIICILTYFASFLMIKTVKKENAEKIMKYTFATFFALYIMLLVTLVLFDSYFGRVGVSNIPKWSRETFEIYFDTSVNFLPLKTVYEFILGAFDKTISMRSMITNIFGNLAAFAPFAFFLPILFEKLRSFKKFSIAMICIVLCAEILQLLLLTGACDIDDLILNVSGACFTYFILDIKCIKKIIEKITDVE